MLNVCITGYDRAERVGKRRNSDESPIRRRAPAKAMREDDQGPGAPRRCWARVQVLASLEWWGVHERRYLRTWSHHGKDCEEIVPLGTTQKRASPAIAEEWRYLGIQHGSERQNRGTTPKATSPVKRE
jgi:hypothetical protein